jgi:hypothetical protein
VVFAMSMRAVPLPILVLLVASDGLRAADDIVPVAPLSQVRLGNFRNFGGGMEPAAALSPDGKTVVMAMHNFVAVYDVSRSLPFTQPRNLTLDGVNVFNAAVAVAPDGKTVLVGPSQHGQDGTVRFFDLASCKEVRQIDNDQIFTGLALSPDGTVLALAGQQGIELWDAASGDELRVLHGPPCRTVTFSPDGRTLVSVGFDSSVVLWETATGKERLKVRIPGEAAPANPRFRHSYNPNTAASALAVSRDGGLLAVGTGESAVRLYELPGGRELPPLVGHLGAVRAVVFTADGKRLVSFDGEGLKLTWSTGRIRQAAAIGLPALSDAEMEDLWDTLAEADAFHAYRAAVCLSADSARTLMLLRRHLKPVPAGDPQRIAGLIADLNNPNAGARRKAMGELRKQGEAAYGALAQLNDHRPAVQMLLARLESQVNTPERQRAIKAVHILERIGSPEAKGLVEKLAGGAAGVPLTVEAKAALDRWAAPAPKSAPATVETLWADLAGEDAARAYRAIGGLAADPRRALALLRANLKPAAGPDLKRVDRCLADLDSDDYATRTKATEELARLGAAAEPALKKALAGERSAEVRRRLDELLARLKAKELPVAVLRQVRAVEVLERLDPGEAGPLLEALARGDPEDRLTREAQAAVRRLQCRAAP